MSSRPVCDYHSRLLNCRLGGARRGFEHRRHAPVVNVDRLVRSSVVDTNAMGGGETAANANSSSSDRRAHDTHFIRTAVPAKLTDHFRTC